LKRVGYPTVNGVVPSSGTPLGSTKVTITGEYLWAGTHGFNNVQNFAPPVIVCLQGQVCDIDFFESTSEKLICFTRPKGPQKKSDIENAPQDAVSAPEDAMAARAAQISNLQCGRLEKAAPGGRVTNDTHFIKVGVGWCGEKKCQDVKQGHLP
jgi:hypothetical protein